MSRSARAVAAAARVNELADGRCAGVRRRRRRESGDAHLHGRRQRCGVRARQAGARRRWARRSCMPAAPGNGQAAKICNNMILGVSMIVGVGGVPAGGEARARRAEAVRHRLEVVGPVLVDDELLPGARAGAGLARQPRLSGRLYRRDDAQGLASWRRRPRARHARSHADGRRRGRASTSASSRTAAARPIFPGSSGSCADLK